ncbi:purple acid phosphatase 5-like [Andrographis paniculata]|uniref:purple acid phosphatase 5-like n=1 Tax=Andrographis paniculata TaxID=175694 RepID=UPI0021E8427F|nr:purple acid phosphatase 5-like [Andrographis paniculata]
MRSFLIICFICVLHFFGVANGSTDMPEESFPPPPGFNAPEQVHITQGDHDGRSMIISWVTPVHPSPNAVTYWEAEGGHRHKSHKSNAVTTTYRYYNYTSGFIHHATTRKLKYDTKYIYEIGHQNASRRFSFTTPPQPGPNAPYTFGVIGDLGQTYDSNRTLEHYMSHSNAQTMLYVGDLSYADNHPFHDNTRWDIWSRFVEKSAANQPWIWTAGNHEIDMAPEIDENTPFKPFMHRFHTPYMASGSISPLFYSIKRGPAYIIVLSSYSSFAVYTPQYQWFHDELPKVNRSETPWLIVLVHAPLYNSNEHHYMEGEGMRVMFEDALVKYKVDIVFSGHVHAYERSHRISNVQYNITNGLSTPIRDPSAPVYITIGDGGNIEGLANEYTSPQPAYSAYREASFGHGLLEIKNSTHAFFTWHRNQDSERTVTDCSWFYNRHWLPHEEPTCDPKTV